MFETKTVGQLFENHAQRPELHFFAAVILFDDVRVCRASNLAIVASDVQTSLFGIIKPALCTRSIMEETAARVLSTVFSPAKSDLDEGALLGSYDELATQIEHLADKAMADETDRSAKITGRNNLSAAHLTVLGLGPRHGKGRRRRATVAL